MSNQYEDLRQELDCVMDMLRLQADKAEEYSMGQADNPYSQGRFMGRAMGLDSALRQLEGMLSMMDAK